MSIVDSTHYLSELVKTLSDNRNSQFYQGEFIVTATVEGVEVISQEPIPCNLTILRDSVRISVMWEEAGYKGYKEMGLFGYSTSNYFNLKDLSARSFETIDKKQKNNILKFEF